MQVEMEAKMKVESHTAVRNLLQAHGGKPAGKFLENNIFFDRDDRSLLAADQGLRLRRRTNIETGENEFIITHKGARQHGPLKSRPETELVVENEVNAIALLENLGFRRTLSFEKRRESWTIGQCKVELDELPMLGTYVEIEGEAEGQIMAMRQMLGLESRPLIRTGYIALIHTHLQEQGIRDREVRFPAS